ncbi:MAG: hypothetical protein OXF78_02150 [Rhodospirillales bacterium]|nr:hypothetical protein [Rhodospirillales bacterium]
MTATPGNGTHSFPEAIPVLRPVNERGALAPHPWTTADGALAAAAFRKLVFASPNDQRRLLVPRGRHTPGMIAASSKRVRT